MKKYIVIFIVITSLTIGGLVYNNSYKKPNPQVKSAEIASLTFAENKVLPFPHPAVIAREKGFFKEEGLEVKFLSFNTGKDAFNAMLSGNAQIAHVAETPVVFLGFTDNSVQIFARIVEGHNVKVLARKDKGIAKPSDLKGKKIGGPKGTVAEFALSELLRINNLSSKDIGFVNLNPIALLNSLSTGQIDAFVIWEPHVQIALQSLRDAVVVFPVEKSLYQIQTSLAANKDWLQNNPEIAKKFLKALVRGEKYIQENPQDSISIVANYMGLDAPILHALKDESKVYIHLDKQGLVEVMREVGSWINRQKPESERKLLPDYNQFINPQILNDIDPSRVK